MAGNSFGRLFTFSSFGESHSECIGGIVEGFPAGIKLDMEFIRKEMSRRKSQSKFTTDRREEDEVVFLSGLDRGITLGTPLAFVIRNNNIRKEDYKDLEGFFRPSHGDFTYFCKYGLNASSGGGRASARETASRVVGGALAKLFLDKFGIKLDSKIVELGGIDYISDKDKAEAKLKQALAERDSLGGVIECTIHNAPAGLGEPVFDKLSSVLAHAAMSIPSSKSFEIGDGLESCKRKGSQDIDHWKESERTLTNHSGGVQAGISNGEDIVFRVGFKPIASIGTLRCKDINGTIKEIDNRGRHDIAPVLRAGVIVEAMAALVIADFIKIQQSNKTI
ncbi:MAG: chorismate synthase [Bacteroidales bacterium]|nr:chorismate synthase [Bacteroidales bacterium]